jgi:hypothetical protein
MSKARTGMEALDGFTADSDNNLYYNGERVVTERKHTFEWYVNVSVILTGAATTVLAIMEVIKYFGK